jgi:hypothetical protein
MKLVLAFVVGFALGGQGGRGDRDHVIDSLGTIGSSEELAAFMMVAKSSVGKTLRELADMIDSDGAEPTAAPDLVDRVRALVEP